MKKVNYLNNKDLLGQIHKSKSSYCSYIDPKYSDYDLIVKDIGGINIRTVAQAKRNKAKKLTQIDYEQRKKANPKTKLSECEIDYRKIQKDDLVFRVMTYEHVPEEPGRKRNPRTVADTKEKVNFPPFKHYILDSKGINPRETVRSHWVGGLHNGHFSVDHGKITNELGKMFMKLVERYSQRGNWRGYTYVDEMRGQALVQLAQIGLQFNEAKSDNPFAYYTATVNNSFTRVLNLEKRNQTIRDDILIEQGHLPSYGRQIQHENQMRELRANAENEVDTTPSSE